MRVLFLRLLAVLAIVAFGWTVVVWLSGGVTVRIGGVRVASTTPWRPLVVALVAVAAILQLAGVSRTGLSLRRLAAHFTPERTAVALAIATTLASLAGNSWTASGPDGFAYVSQAALWRSGRTAIPASLGADAPWPDAVASFVPFGYRAAPNGAPELVPVTAPGVPLLMASLQVLAGHSAAFVVTPLMSGILVLTTFLVGRAVRSGWTGVAAAWLVATSPALLFMLMWPMSDVPAAACTAMMVWLLLGRSTGSALAAGLVASAAALMRTNTIVVSAAAALWLLVECRDGQRQRWMRLVAFAAGALPGPAVIAWLNYHWYGSAVSSGYGTAMTMFAASRIRTNALRYLQWIAATSPLTLLGLAALPMGALGRWRGFSRPGSALLLTLVMIAVAGVYLVYEPFADWWYLRFLLPAWPALFVATAVVCDAAAARGKVASIAITAIVLAAGVAGVLEARARGVFKLGVGERRYATIAHLVDANTEPDAVILTVQHSGTVRYYAGRETLRFDLLDANWLDRAVTWLQARGRHPYVLVEDWEQPQFETRFRSNNALGKLSYPPVVAWESSHTPGWVYLYDPLRRDAATLRPGPEFEASEPFSAKPVRFP